MSTELSSGLLALWIRATSWRHDDERGISTIVEILAACLLIILVYAGLQQPVQEGVKNVVDSVFEKLTSAA